MNLAIIGFCFLAGSLLPRNVYAVSEDGPCYKSIICNNRAMTLWYTPQSPNTANIKIIGVNTENRHWLGPLDFKNSSLEASWIETIATPKKHECYVQMKEDLKSLPNFMENLAEVTCALPVIPFGLGWDSILNLFEDDYFNKDASIRITIDNEGKAEARLVLYSETQEMECRLLP